MDPSKLEAELKQYNHIEGTTMSPLVRSRLDETYASLPEMSTEQRRATRPRIRRTVSVAVATVMLGAAVFASGFISPVMAQSIKHVKLNVMETVFDGTHAVFLLDVTAPNLKDGMFDTGEKVVKLSNAIDSVNDSSAGGAHPNVLIFEEILAADDPNASSKIPDTFNAKVLVKPVTTRLLTTITLDDQATDQWTHTRVAVFDDQDRQLPALNGEGTLEDHTIIFDGRYASTGKTKYLIIKPFVFQDDFSEKVRDDQFIKGLELKMELPGHNE